MDRRSWLWRRKSSERSPGEADSCGSVSSFSEKCSDDQEATKASPNAAQSPDVSSNVAGYEDGDTVKSLTEKLASALLSIRAKEELVSQHAKVAEEAVSGWEMAEKEMASLRRQLETATQKNSTLVERIEQLDGALKECVRQLQHTRNEQIQMLQDALARKSQEWESEKFGLEGRLVELEVQLNAAREMPPSASHDFQLKLEKMEKENEVLRSELLAQSEELSTRILERDLSNRAAEAASRQHLESTKKVKKLEAECRMLHAMARRCSAGGYCSRAGSVVVHPRSDGPTDSRERSDDRTSCPDAWASTLIAELDQFSPARAALGQNPTSSVEIDLMDDFLVMEKLVALPETYSDDTRSTSLETDLEVSHGRISELEEKGRKMEIEKAHVEKQLAETQDRLESTCKQLERAEMELADVRRQLQFANESRLAAESAARDAEGRRKLLDSQLESADLREQELREEIALLEAKVEEGEALSAELASKCRDWEDKLVKSLQEAEARRQLLESQFESANLRAQQLDQKISLLEAKVGLESSRSAELATKCRSLEDELSERKREAEARRTGIHNGELIIKQDNELAIAARRRFAECQDTITSISQQLKSLAALNEFACEEGGDEAGASGASTQVPWSGGPRKTGWKLTSADAGGSPCGMPPWSTPSPPSYFQDLQKNLSQYRVDSRITYQSVHEKMGKSQVIDA